MLRELARFSSDVVDQFGAFLLREERGEGFERVCSQAQEFFANLGNPKLESYGMPSEYGTLQFSQSSEAVRVIYRATSHDPSGLRQTWDDLAKAVERIRQAHGIDSVRDDVRMTRDWFYRLSRIIRSTMRAQEKVIAA